MSDSVADTRGPGRRLAHGAATGLLVWTAEVAAVGIGALGVGGWPVLLGLRDELARWGLGYLLAGAALGTLGRFSRAGPVLGWIVLLAAADAGVVPRPLHAAVIGVGLGLAHLLHGLSDRALAGLPAGAALLLAAASVRAPLPAPAGRPSDRPDVVLLVVDTLRADHVGYAGYAPITPHLDRLAAEGVVYTRARSPSSWTLPAHASLFTGLLPAAHGAHAGHPRLPAGVPTLAERLDARGYRTTGLSANAWVSAGTGLDRGFDRFVFLGDDGIVSQLLLPLVFARPRDLGGRAITDAAVAALDAEATPVFLFANYLEAHEPLGTLPGDARPAEVDPVAGRRWMRDMPRFWCACGEGAAAGDLLCADGLFRAPPARIRAVTAAYDAGIAYVDARIGEVVQAIARRGRPTWLVVTSDHGEHLGEDGRLGHMVWLDAPLLDVPLIVRGPGVPPGAVDTAPIGLDELAPLLLARVDGAPPPARRLRATSEVHAHPAATARRWQTLFGCDFAPITVDRRVVTDGDRVVVRTDDAVRVEVDGVARPPTPTESAWVDAPFDAGTGAVDPATRDALRALGYLD